MLGETPANAKGMGEWGNILYFQETWLISLRKKVKFPLIYVTTVTEDAQRSKGQLYSSIPKQNTGGGGEGIHDGS